MVVPNRQMTGNLIGTKKWKINYVIHIILQCMSTENGHCFFIIQVTCEREIHDKNFEGK